MPVDSKSRKPATKGKGKGSGLNKKLGPLPLWAWGLGLAAAIGIGLILRRHNGQTGTVAAEPQPNPGGGGGGLSPLDNPGASPDFSGLEDEIAALRDQISLMSGFNGGDMLPFDYFPPDSGADPGVLPFGHPQLDDQVGMDALYPTPGVRQTGGPVSLNSTTVGRRPNRAPAARAPRGSPNKAPGRAPHQTITYSYFGVQSTPAVSRYVAEHPYVSQQIAHGGYDPVASAAARERVRQQTGGHSGGGKVYAE